MTAALKTIAEEEEDIIDLDELHEELESLERGLHIQ